MDITVSELGVPDAKLITPQVFEDARGFFLEGWRQDVYAEAGLPTEFVQLNHSRSSHGVVRGLHFQWSPPMGKLMRVISGEAYLVGVDIRKDSPTLGKWFGVDVSADSRQLVWAPPGFARGFCVTGPHAEIEYLCTGTYNGGAEGGIAWDDPAIGIDWPVMNADLSTRDAAAPSLQEWLARPESDAFRMHP